MISESFLTKPMLIGAVAGATIGAGLGFWSIRHTTTPATPPVGPPIAVVEPIAVATNGTAGESAPASPRTTAAGGTVRQRASMLAQHGDVTALLAMREAVLRQAEQRAEQGSTATTRELDEIDRSLADARETRLKLDGAALRRLDKQPR